MKRILVVGASGMLGHRLVRGLSADFNVTGTVRGDAADWAALPHFANATVLGSVDALDFSTVANAVETARPELVINAVGAIKQVADGKSAVPAIRLNALFPHQLAEAAGRAGARLITFSTDCVFSGKKGPYQETDTPDATDVYGRSKLLGEVTAPGCLTLRSSIIGRELRGRHSLVDWFISQNGGRVKGFRGALYSGMTTGAASNLVTAILRTKPELEGLWQVAAQPINKYELLKLVRDAMGLTIDIAPDDDFHCDRRLDGSRFAQETGLALPSWPQMIADLAAEAPFYSASAR